MIKINIYYWNNGVGLKNDIILLTQVLKEFDVITYDVSKEIINDNRIEEICGKNYNSITDFINFNFEYDLVLKTPEKFESGFKLKNDPGKILPIIINIVNKQLE